MPTPKATREDMESAWRGNGDAYIELPWREIVWTRSRIWPRFALWGVVFADMLAVDTVVKE